MATATVDIHGALAPVPVTLVGWGGGAASGARLWRPDSLEQLSGGLSRLPQGNGLIPRGMGRAYGDAAQLAGGVAIDTTALRTVALDRDTGIAIAGAGVTIAELLTQTVPHGWIVPVVPGTQHVSVGGAIASDIHGKNHGTAGTFGSHVRSLELLCADGELVRLTPEDPLFGATLGGMGLTGVIVSADVALRAIVSPALAVDTDRADTLDGVLTLLNGPGGPHRVAWLDLLGSRAGRGVVTRADHIGDRGAAGAAAGEATVVSRATVPERFPSALLASSTVRAFNELRFRTSPRHERGRVEPFGQHMFPLDVLSAWPRLYGPRGFVQYQLVVPPGREDVLERTIAVLRQARVPCYLAVLKDFGHANQAPLSFPIKGWTLALDLPRAAPGLASALDELDTLVAEAGGRVYLSKDSRLRPDALRAMYPRLEEWRAIRDRADPDGVWRSDLSERTGLTTR
jgi:decaprenylphospho-beta-D-ribofuranose 2-oxidase